MKSLRGISPTPPRLTAAIYPPVQKLCRDWWKLKCHARKTNWTPRTVITGKLTAKVHNLSSGQPCTSVTEASRRIGCAYGSVRNMLKGKRYKIVLIAPGPRYVSRWRAATNWIVRQIPILAYFTKRNHTIFSEESTFCLHSSNYFQQWINLIKRNPFIYRGPHCKVIGKIMCGQRFTASQ